QLRPLSTLFPYTTLFRSRQAGLRLVFDNGLLLTVSRSLIGFRLLLDYDGSALHLTLQEYRTLLQSYRRARRTVHVRSRKEDSSRSEEHTSELQSPCNLVC